MVKAFGAEVQPTNDPSYIGFSREGDADRSMKILFSGIGNLIDQKSDFLEEKQKQDADAAAESIVNTTTDGVTGATGDASVFGSPAGDTVNTEIRNVGSRGQKLTQAYKEGRITQSNYWAQMDSLVKAAKARYPAQADRIEAQVSQALGRNPAAASIETAREEWKSSLAETNEEEKAFNRFVDTNNEFLPPDFFVRQSQGRPYTKIETRHYVMERAQEKNAISLKQSKLTLAKEQGNLNEEQAVGTALDEVNQFTNRILTDTADTNKDFSSLLSKAREKGKDFSPDEQMAMRKSFAELKFKVQEGVENILTKTMADNKSTYLNLIKSPEKLKHIRETALSRIDYYEKLINDKDYGLLNADVNRTKAMRDEVNRKVLESSDAIRTYEAIKEIGGGDLLNEFLLSKEGQKLKTDAAKSLHRISVARMMSGDAQSLDSELKKTKGANLEKGEQGKVNFYTIKNAVDILTNNGRYYKSGESPTQIKINTARSLFGAQNRHFLSNIAPDQKTLIWSRLAAPEVTEEMVKLRKVDPQLWSDYKEWAKIGFGQTFSGLARDIQEGITARPNVNIGWDSKAKQFTLASTPSRTRKATNVFSASQQVVEEYFTGGIEKSVNEFNKQLRILTPIMEADGQDVSEELLGFIQSMNIDDMAPKELSFFSKVRQGLINAFEMNAGGSEDANGKKR